MRKIEFVPIPMGWTKVLIDGVELKTRLDAPDMREYRYHLGKQFSIGYAHNIIDEALKKLHAELVLDADEVSVVIKYLRQELGI